MTSRTSGWVGGTLAVFVIWLICRRLSHGPSSWWFLLWEAQFSAGFFSRSIWRLIKKPKTGDPWKSKT